MVNAWLAFVGVLLTGLAIIDWRYRAIPRIVWPPLLGIGVIRVWIPIGFEIGNEQSMYVLSVMALSFLAAAAIYVTGGGLADVMLMLAGSILTPTVWVAVIVAAIVLAAVGIIALIIYRSDGNAPRIPFFPFVAAAFWLVVLLGGGA